MNPQFKGIGPTKDLWRNDKSHNKKTSSNIMWAIALYADSESQVSNYVDSDKARYINKEILNDKDDVRKYPKIIDHYIKLQETAALRQLRIWEKKMDEKTALLEAMPYTKDTAEFIEKVLSSNTKLYAEHKRIKKELQNEEMEGRVTGGSEESLMEKGDLNNDD